MTNTKTIERQLGQQIKTQYSTSYRVKLMSLLLSRLTEEADALKAELDEAMGQYEPIVFAAIYGLKASAYCVLVKDIKILKDEIKLLG